MFFRSCSNIFPLFCLVGKKRTWIIRRVVKSRLFSVYPSYSILIFPSKIAQRRKVDQLVLTVQKRPHDAKMEVQFWMYFCWSMLNPYNSCCTCCSILVIWTLTLKRKHFLHIHKCFSHLLNSFLFSGESWPFFIQTSRRFCSKFQAPSLFSVARGESPNMCRRKPKTIFGAWTAKSVDYRRSEY